ncbi:MAG: ComEA family DNA-binding protein [Leptolyngbyaceae cyanobacterium bins.59]|nr:ComEA family DNA-binding protein [Leptolyngbyaceae cyanobacterium bins.59]
MTLWQWFTSAVRSPLETRLLSDPYYRMQSYKEVRVAARLGIQIDANRATIDDWLRLPGLSIHQARLLVELAQAGVQFLGIEDVAACLGLPAERLSPLTPVLQFHYYDRESLLWPQPINPNTASPEVLAQLPGLSQERVEAILLHRQQGGAFKNLVDFQQRLQLSGGELGRCMHYFRF